MKDPEPYLQEQQIALPCPVHPDRPAVLSPELRERVNWEIYYFSDAAALKEFRKDPIRWCGTLTDPVDGKRFKPSADSPKTTWHGRLYVFTSKQNRSAFRKTPDRYADRMGM